MRHRHLLLAGVVGMLLPVETRAQTASTTAPQNIPETVKVTRERAAPEVPHTAAQFAPSRPLIEEVQPTSRVDEAVIKKTVVQSADYNDVVTLTPSATDIAPAGAGLQQDFGQSIRGLQYTEFSVLWDGIPVPGFPFNLSPQPGAYFFSRDFSSVTVNRGPGGASTIGPATFGGWVDLASANPTADPNGEIYGTFGSFGTKLFGIQGNSGTISQTGGTRVLLDLTREEGTGALTGIATERRNAYIKLTQPVGQSTTVTVAANLDSDNTKTPYGATLPDIDQFGRNYALNSNPGSQTFNGYNRDMYDTDFEYIEVNSDLGAGWTLDNKVYRTEYIQRDRHGLDPDGDTPNLSGTVYIDGQAVNADNDVPGLLGHFDFGDWGDVLRFTKATRYGEFRIGAWIDRQGLTFYQYQVDFSRSAVPYSDALGGSAFLSNFFAANLTVQPYIEYAWKPVRNLTITGGIKYSSVTRSLNGPIGLDGMPSNDHQTWNKALPSLDLNWRVRPYLSVFAQAARGFLTPELNLFGTTLPVSVQPSTTWSFQTGTVFQKDWATLGVDLYDIEFSDYIEGVTVGGEPDFVNGGGATFRGVEVEGTAKLGAGFALYANGTLNDSMYNTNGNNLAQTPRRTAAAALLWDRGDIIREGDELFANGTYKVVGPQYGVDSAVRGTSDLFPIKTWDEVNLNLGYHLPVWDQKLTFEVQVTNLLDNRSLVGIFGETLEGTALYAVHAGRGIFFSVSDTVF